MQKIGRCRDQLIYGCRGREIFCKPPSPSIFSKENFKECFKCNVQHPIAKFRSNIRNVRFKMADPAGTENCKRSKKRTKNTPSPRENTPPRKYPRNRRVVPSPSEDVPAASRTRRMAKEMKKLRSLHILHVPPSRSKTKAR